MLHIEHKVTHPPKGNKLPGWERLYTLVEYYFYVHRHFT